MDGDDDAIAALQGLGEKSAKHLAQIGVFTRSDLAAIGPVKAYFLLKKRAIARPSLNFLYAMAGALEGVSWLKIAQTQKAALLMELDAQEELEKLMRESD